MLCWLTSKHQLERTDAALRFGRHISRFRRRGWRWRGRRLDLAKRGGNKLAPGLFLPFLFALLDVAVNGFQIVIKKGRVGVADYSDFIDDRVVHGLDPKISSRVQMIGALKP